jgi:hypothetical protein
VQKFDSDHGDEAGARAKEIIKHTISVPGDDASDGNAYQGT